MMSFQLPLELMLLANLALSFNLVLPLPLSRPGVALCRFSTTPVGQGITAAAFSILLLLLIQPLYDMSNLNMQKEAAAETITHRDRRCGAVKDNVHGIVYRSPVSRILPDMCEQLHGARFIHGQYGNISNIQECLMQVCGGQCTSSNVPYSMQHSPANHQQDTRACERPDR